MKRRKPLKGGFLFVRNVIKCDYGKEKRRSEEESFRAVKERGTGSPRTAGWVLAAGVSGGDDFDSDYSGGDLVWGWGRDFEHYSYARGGDTGSGDVLYSGVFGIYSREDFPE